MDNYKKTLKVCDSQGLKLNGRMMGLEPTTYRTTNCRSNLLSYTLHIVWSAKIGKILFYKKGNFRLKESFFEG